MARNLTKRDKLRNAVLREYLWLGMMPLAYVDWSSGSAVTYYVHTDQVMVPQKLTNSAKAVVFDRVAEPFGVEISATGSLTQALRFPGQRHDAETGFSQIWHRDYDPFLGRYVQSDPIGLMGGINTYAYVGGNPLVGVDPTGEFLAAAVPAAIWLYRGYRVATGVLGAAALANTDNTLRAPSPPDDNICSGRPDDDDCDEEWEHAYRECALRRGDPNYRNIACFLEHAAELMCQGSGLRTMWRKSS